MAVLLGNAAPCQGPLQMGSGLTEILDSRIDVQSCSMPTSSSYGPPRPTVVSRAHTMTTTITVAPAKSAVAAKKRRRGRRRPDAGEGGGDDDGGPGDGGFWGGDGWESNDDEGGNWSFSIQNLWIWQAICICGLLQAVQYLAAEQRQVSDHHQKPLVAFAQ